MTWYKSSYWILLLILTVFLVTTNASAQDAQPKAKKTAKAAKAAKSPSPPPVPPPDFTLEPKAMDILKAACNRLAAAKSMAFTAVVSYESPRRLGAPLIYPTKSEVALQRPDKLKVITSGDGPASEFYYDGKTMMAFEPAANLAAVADAPGDIPSDSSFAGQVAAPSTPPTPEQMATAQQLGAEIASQLVVEIAGMGLTAGRASQQTPMQLNDLMIRGYLLSIEEGSEVKRLAIGFGAGASELKTMVEVYQLTDRGMQKLGSGTLDAGGSKTPGAALGVASLVATGNPAGLIISTGMKVYGEESGRSTVEGRADQTAKEIAAKLKVRFQEQGWVQ